MSDRRRWLWLSLLIVLHASRLAAGDSSPRVVTTGLLPPELAAIDDLMTGYMTRHDVPGAALALVKDGRLVLARGYGWADPDQRHKVQPDSLFRIASLSKPITAVGILQLDERKKLSLDTKVFDLLELKQHAGNGRRIDPLLKQVTLRQLLQHTGGFDRRQSLDPMFHSMLISRRLGQRPPAKAMDVIRYMTTQSLDFPPGRRHAYSNYGYCLLGRCIEKVTGESYETYIRDQVLKPLGMRDTQQGKTLADGRAKHEVTYHARGRRGLAVIGPIGQSVPRPYGAWYLEAMDANGGWVSSAVDMARFISAFDRPERCTILSERSVKTMFARPDDAAGYHPDGAPKRVYYACGWFLRSRRNGRDIQWHAGTLDGTAAIMARRYDGLNWVALFNADTGPRGEHLGDTLVRPFEQVIGGIQKWPDVDLFQDDKLR